jgi:molybdopterin synthase sulfur carrier subunit
MARVYIPPQLRDLTGGVSELDVAGSTVRELVAQLERRFPGIEQRLCASGELAPNLQVSIGDQLSRRGLDAPVPPDGEIHFLPVFGGG